MIEIGGKPILWHIMKIYSHYGYNDFVICLGYKGYVIKEYFANYFLHMADVTFDMANNKMEVHKKHAEPWKVTLVETGANTMTGGRIKKVQPYIGDETLITFAKTIKIGNIVIDATNLGIAKYLILLMPIVSNASICSVTFIDPNSAAIDAPTLPAIIIPVSTGPSSVIIALLVAVPKNEIGANPFN